MPKYIVRWFAEVEAHTAHDAAAKAQRATHSMMAYVRRPDAPAWLAIDAARAAPATPTQSLREALWILAEHSALYFGEMHSTTSLARETLAGLESQLPALLRAYEDAAFNRGEGEDYGGHKLNEARAAIHSFLGLPQEE
jgi:hypothetical protein